FENGYYNPQTMRIEVPAVSNAPVSSVENTSNNMLMVLMNKNIEVLEEIKESGVIAYISKDYREMKKLQEQLDKYKALKEKQRQ
ncbi:MAG TPA: hypothetical protein DDZ41_11890, partial [Flavobacterium sp.]|nr:hypothetical protein [Flavobacterium sp.]